MSEPIWVTMKVKFPKAWYDEGQDPPWWYADLREAFINGDAFIDPTGDDGWAATIQGEGNYGSSDSWAEEGLAWLAANGVPHEIHDEAKYEFQAEDRFFDGREWWSGVSAGEDSALTSVTWSAFKSSSKSYAELTWKVDEYFRRMAWHVEDADISHLPYTMPAKPQEETDASQ